MVRRFVVPSVFILVGLFFILLPFVGTKNESPHAGALTLISLAFGFLAAGVSVWYMVSGYRSRSRPTVQ